MERRRIGELEPTVLGVDTAAFATTVDGETAAATVHAAVDAGLNLIVASDGYADGEAERYLAPALQGIRDDVVLATGVGQRLPPEVFAEQRRTPGDPAWIRRAVDDSLFRLDTDWIDLYTFHGPDRAVDIDRTLETLHELVVAGKVRELALAGFDATPLDEARDAAADLHITPPRAVVHRYSPTERDPERELLGWCAEHAIGLVAAGVDPTAPDPHVESFARAYDLTVAEITVGYPLAAPEVVAVPLAVSSPSGVAAAVERPVWQPSPDRLAELREHLDARPAPADDEG